MPNRSDMCDRIHQHPVTGSQSAKTVKKWVNQGQLGFKELAKRRSPAISLFFHNQWPETGHSNQLKKLKLHEEVKKEMC